MSPCFTKRAEYLGVLTFFGSHKNFCRPKAPKYKFKLALSYPQDGKWGKVEFPKSTF